jgi:hypothetical protein
MSTNVSLSEQSAIVEAYRRGASASRIARARRRPRRVVVAVLRHAEIMIVRRKSNIDRGGF